MSDALPLKSVHWTTGMLLTPGQLLHQDRYTDAVAGWALRYLADAAGLVGGGARAARTPERLVDHDPGVDVQDEAGHVAVTVSSVRGITPSGRVVEIAPEDALRERFPKSDLEWADELLLSVVHTGEKEADSATAAEPDEVEPALPLHRVRYQVRLAAAADEEAHALVLARLRREANSRRFVPDDAYLPPCAAITAHSRMYRAWEEMGTVLDQQAAVAFVLHAEAARYLAVLGGSGLSSPVDEEILACVERLALAVDACARGVDPALPPGRLFAAVGRLDREAALALGVVAFRDELLQLVPEAEPARGVFAADGRSAPDAWRKAHAGHDLAASVEQARASLGRLSRLLSGIGERYRDYRVCRVLPSLRYVLDPEDQEVWERRDQAPAGARGDETRTFVFPALRLGPGAYRLVLAADPDEVDTRGAGPAPSLTLQLNPVPGGGVHAQARSLVATVDGQRNFAVSFDVPDGDLLSALVAEVRTGARFPRALLYRVWDGRTAPAHEAQGTPPSPHLEHGSGSEGGQRRPGWDQIRVRVN